MSDAGRLGAIGGVAGLVGDILLNSGELLVTLFALLISSPDIWVSMLLYMQRLGDLFGVPIGGIEPLIAIGIVLLLLMYARQLVNRLRSDS